MFSLMIQKMFDNAHQVLSFLVEIQLSFNNTIILIFLMFYSVDCDDNDNDDNY